MPLLLARAGKEFIPLGRYFLDLMPDLACFLPITVPACFLPITVPACC